MRHQLSIYLNFFAAVFGLAFVIVVDRILKNVDLSDESYYALFSYFWIKYGLSMSPLRDIHASAALIIYPIVSTFVKIQHGDRGLLLMLRCCYLLGSIMSSISLVRLFILWGRGRAAWLAGALGLIFIPFGLPAPSYNTLGLQGEMFGLAWFGIALLWLGRGDKAAPALVLSACGFTVGMLAYPTLFLPVPVLIGASAFVFPPFRRQLLLYGVFTLMLMVAGWAAVGWALTWSALSETLAIQRDAGSLGLWGKIASSVALLAGAPTFTLLCGIAILIGLCRPLLSSVAAAMAMAVVLLALCFLPATLFIRSHDAVVLASFMGFGLLAGLSRARPVQQKLEAVLYAGALCGGLVTMLTTSNPALLNFAVGGAPAAILAILPWTDGSSSQENSAGRLLALSAAAVMVVLVGWVSFSFRYGDLPTDTVKAQRRFTTGAFAGLSLSTDQARLIEVAGAMLNHPERPTQTLAVLGRLPGLYLTSSALPSALRTFYLEPTTNPYVTQDIHEFYTLKRPDLVAIFDDPYLPVINPMLPEFDLNYVVVDRQNTPTGHLTLYRRIAEQR